MEWNGLIWNGADRINRPLSISPIANLVLRSPPHENLNSRRTFGVKIVNAMHLEMIFQDEIS